jgi:mono/diheme cytochrome c family protein
LIAVHVRPALVRLLLLLIVLPMCSGAQESEDPITRGSYVATAAGCLSCHTDSEHDGAEYAGGHALETSSGVFYTPNITPDKETGIGNWSESEFLTALREGIAPNGASYYPAFPYPSYAGMTDRDARDLYAYLQSLDPVARQNQPNVLRWYVPGRGAMSAWRSRYAPWNYPPIPADADPLWARGAYLVRHLGHCGECHTKRSVFGALKLNADLAGSPEDDAGGGAADITAGNTDGIRNWSDDELLFFFELGMLPDGDFVGGNMVAVVDENTALLTDEDRAAIVVYLRNLDGPPAED